MLSALLWVWMMPLPRMAGPRPAGRSAPKLLSRRTNAVKPIQQKPIGKPHENKLQSCLHVSRLRRSGAPWGKLKKPGGVVVILRPPAPCRSSARPRAVYPSSLCQRTSYWRILRGKSCRPQWSARAGPVGTTRGALRRRYDFGTRTVVVQISKPRQERRDAPSFADALTATASMRKVNHE